jgi:hypothetical protein
MVTIQSASGHLIILCIIQIKYPELVISYWVSRGLRDSLVEIMDETVDLVDILYTE